MVTIGEELNVRDRPIYLQFSVLSDAFNPFWYVIKEKKVVKRNNRNIYPATDEIRELEVPPLKFPVNADSLIVFNSRIYIIGGYIPWQFYWEFSEDPEVRDVSGNICSAVFYYDTKNPEENWLKGPTLNLCRYKQVVAALENSGIFVAIGMPRDSFNQSLAEFLDVSLNDTWWTAPPIPGPEHSDINNLRLLAVTDTKVYIYCVGYDRYHVGMGLSYDILNSEWNFFDKNFDKNLQDMWFPGVVLDFSSSSYLFLFGSRKSTDGRRKSTDDEECTEKLCVYDLNNYTWLHSVYLPGSVLPKEITREDSDDEVIDCIGRKYLLRVNQNKLALVWSKNSYCYPGATKIYCTKFNIRCTFRRDSQHPIFRAEVVSFGYFHVRDDTMLRNCAA